MTRDRGTNENIKQDEETRPRQKKRISRKFHSEGNPKNPTKSSREKMFRKIQEALQGRYGMTREFERDV